MAFTEYTLTYKTATRSENYQDIFQFRKGKFMNKEDKSLAPLFDVWHFNFLNYQLKIIPLHLLLYSFLCKLKDTSLKIKKKKE